MNQISLLRCKQCGEDNEEKFELDGSWVICLSCHWKWSGPDYIKAKQARDYCKGCYWKLNGQICPFQRCVKRYGFSLKATS